MCVRFPAQHLVNECFPSSEIMSRLICAPSPTAAQRKQNMANNRKRDPNNDARIASQDGMGLDAEARAYLNELKADEDAARCDWADDGECVDREFGIDPTNDLPE